MLRVLHIYPGLTIDSNIETIDDMIITIDSNGGNILKVPFREPFVANVTLIMKNEMKGTIHNYDTLAEDLGNGGMLLRFSHNFKDWDSYEAKIVEQGKTENKWRGRIFITDQTDLQNYKIYDI